MTRVRSACAVESASPRGPSRYRAQSGGGDSFEPAAVVREQPPRDRSGKGRARRPGKRIRPLRGPSERDRHPAGPLATGPSCSAGIQSARCPRVRTERGFGYGCTRPARRRGPRIIGEVRRAVPRREARALFPDHVDRATDCQFIVATTLHARNASGALSATPDASRVESCERGRLTTPVSTVRRRQRGRCCSGRTGETLTERVLPAGGSSSRRLNETRLIDGDPV